MNKKRRRILFLVVALTIILIVAGLGLFLYLPSNNNINAIGYSVSKNILSGTSRNLRLTISGPSVYTYESPFWKCFASDRSFIVVAIHVPSYLLEMPDKIYEGIDDKEPDIPRHQWLSIDPSDFILVTGGGLKKQGILVATGWTESFLHGINLSEWPRRFCPSYRVGNVPQKWWERGNHLHQRLFREKLSYESVTIAFLVEDKEVKEPYYIKFRDLPSVRVPNAILQNIFDIKWFVEITYPESASLGQALRDLGIDEDEMVGYHIDIDDKEDTATVGPFRSESEATKVAKALQQAISGKAYVKKEGPSND